MRFLALMEEASRPFRIFCQRFREAYLPPTISPCGLCWVISS